MVRRISGMRLSHEFMRRATKAIDKTRCFAVEMDPALRSRAWASRPPSQDERRKHRGAMESCFLPLFRHAGSCLFFGEEPAEIAKPSPGLSIAPEGNGWVISPTRKFRGAFPYWIWDQETANRFTLLLRVNLDVADDEAALATLFSQSWDPLIYKNPTFVQPAAYTFARRTSSRSSLLWLAYHTGCKYLNIAVIASRENAVRAYELALKHARAKYWAPSH